MMRLTARKRARGPSAFAPAVGVKGAASTGVAAGASTATLDAPHKSAAAPRDGARAIAWKAAALHLLSGGLSAGLVRASLQPLDTCKTRLQAARLPSYSLRSVSALLFGDGVRGLYRGVVPGVVGIVPAAAVYMLTFQTLKRRLSRRFPARQRDVVVAMSAAVGDVAASLVRVPCEVLKQRLQVGMYSNVSQAVRAASRLPLRSMYAGLSAQLARDVPYAAVEFVVYENLKARLKTDERLAKRARLHSLLVGGVSGAVAALVSNPMDVVKTRLMTQTASSVVRYRGVAHALTTVATNEGVRAFAKGIAPRIAAKTLQSALFFAAYERVKSSLAQMLGVTEEAAAVAAKGSAL
eukprot:TRINITY_DN40297_c0_g1_i1.p2 TRINITY_DN40297_c0_g1~~TRINITY_DN40297_c0_g1_i1.p2  ORF type:complete len:352 (-),score=105.22 TRINITY_DN40297_c0_g1_i1:1153-2208(-)